MSTSRIKRTLQPRSGEARARVTNSGRVPAVARPKAVRRLIDRLARWSGQLILGASCAAAPGEWCEIWRRGLGDVPRAHLKLDSDSTRGVVLDVDRQMSLFGAEP